MIAYVNNVCFSGRLTYANGAPYPRSQLDEYLPRVGLKVLERVRSDCDMLVVAHPSVNTHKTREADRLQFSGSGVATVNWAQFAEHFQVGGWAHPPHPRWWRNREGVLLCEVNDLFEIGETFRFVPSERKEGALLASPVDEPFRMSSKMRSPLAGRLVAVHRAA